MLERIDRNEKVVFKFLDDPELSAEVVRLHHLGLATAAHLHPILIDPHDDHPDAPFDRIRDLTELLD